MGGQRARVWVSAGFGRRVKSRVARSIARRFATRDTMRLRRPDPSIVPIERARSNVGGVARARVREPKNADGGGFHRPARSRSSRHAPAPLFLSLPFPTPPPLPDAAASFGAFFSTVVQPSSTIARVSTERAVAAKRRFRLVRRLRGGREGTATTTRTRSLENRVASTRRRVPGCVYRARGRSRTRTERGGTCERLCVWAAPTLLFHTQREWKWNFSLRVFCRDEQWTFSAGKRQIYAGEQSEVFARTNVFSRAMAQSARPKINAFENRSSRPGRLQRPLL